MDTLAERLKYALYLLGLNQAEAAKISGISQQSINYIIKNNLNASRLSSKIADGLNINSEWLINGKGEMNSPKIYKIPLIFDYLSLQLYMNDRKIDKETAYLLTHRFISAKPFAVKTEINKLCICKKLSDEDSENLIDDYLCYDEKGMVIIKSHMLDLKDRNSIYKIVEWREYDMNIARRWRELRL